MNTKNCSKKKTLKKKVKNEEDGIRTLLVLHKFKKID